MTEFNDYMEKIKFVAALYLQNELRESCPVDKGLLKLSINVIPTKEGFLIKMKDYGEYIEFGTNPYIIRAINKKVLRFTIGGKEIFTREVHHPGIRPNPFIRTTIFTKLDEILSQASKAI